MFGDAVEKFIWDVPAVNVRFARALSVVPSEKLPLPVIVEEPKFIVRALELFELISPVVRE
jgi:hypothetical protein